MLQSRRRRRYGHYELVQPPAKKYRGKIIGGIAIAIIVFSGMKLLLGVFSPSISGQRVATVLRTDGRGAVDVTIGGEKNFQRAQSGLRLYSLDRVRTDSASYALLNFFDNTVVGLDTGTTVKLDEVIFGEESSAISLTIEEGRIWVSTGTGMQVARIVHTALSKHILPANSVAIIGANDVLSNQIDLMVFTSVGPGVESFFSLDRSNTSVVVGEGQMLRLSPERLQEVASGSRDPYDLRDPLTPDALSSPLHERFTLVGETASSDPESVPSSIEESGDTVLVVDSPGEGDFIDGSTVLVKGKVNARVTHVRINGYEAEIKEGIFEKEIALPSQEAFSIEIQAENADGLTIGSKNLSLTRDIRPPSPPVIASPGGSGDTIQINVDTFEIRGTSSTDSVGIVVNGYQLQKYRPGGPWEYLVDPALGNVRIGENTYEVYSVDRAGNRSASTKILIVWKAQIAPSVYEDEEVSDDGTYLSQGSLRIIAPTDGSLFVTSSNEEVLIEGETAAETHSISINGFTLTKYLPGKTTWNYIASIEYGNYKKGINRYVVVARNSEGKILDVLRYIIEWK